MLGFGKRASIGVAALFGGAAVKGFYDQVAPATINNAMDIAFGDPEADRAILGTDLTRINGLYGQWTSWNRYCQSCKY
jgi:hypothetical protein